MQRNGGTMRLTKQQQRDVLAAMLEEARQRTAQGFSVGEVEKQVRDDMKSAIRQGLIVTPTQSKRTLVTNKADAHEWMASCVD